MKKIIALLLALVMVMGLATVVSATTPAAPSYSQDGVTYTDEGTVTIQKVYKETNENSVSPAETFTFTAFTCTGVANTGLKADGTAVTTADAPIPTIATVSYAQGDASVDGTAKDIVITLPEISAFPNVGEYTYKFAEVGTNEYAGVTYYTTDMKLVVTVIQDGDNGKLRIGSVYCQPVEGDEKTESFVNTYSAGDLAVSKTVTGNLGDRTKYFPVTVTFNSDKVVMAPITISDGSYAQNPTVINPSEWTEGVATATIYVKHGDTVNFKNIPYGVTYTVDEDTPSDYTATGEQTTGVEVTGPTASVSITNNKSSNVDTGIAMDSVPFIVMAVVAVIGLAAFTAKKRVQE